MNYACERAGPGSSFLPAISPLKCNFAGLGIRTANELFAAALGNEAATKGVVRKTTTKTSVSARWSTVESRAMERDKSSRDTGG